MLTTNRSQCIPKLLQSRDIGASQLASVGCQPRPWTMGDQNAQKTSTTAIKRDMRTSEGRRERTKVSKVAKKETGSEGHTTCIGRRGAGSIALAAPTELMSRCRAETAPNLHLHVSDRSLEDLSRHYNFFAVSKYVMFLIFHSTVLWSIQLFIVLVQSTRPRVLPLHVIKSNRQY